MRQEAKLWFEDAENDFVCAKDMLEKKHYHYVVWLSRQSVEKALKAAHLVVKQKPIPQTHNLLELARKIEEEIPEAMESNIVFLNPHYTVTRYVDAAVGKPSDLFDEDFAKEALEKAKEVFEWVRKTHLT